MSAGTMNCNLFRAARMGYIKAVFSYCKRWGWMDMITQTCSESFTLGLTKNLGSTQYFGLFQCDEFTLIRFFGVYLRIGTSENCGE